MFKLKTRIKDRVKLQEILTKNPKKSNATNVNNF